MEEQIFQTEILKINNRKLTASMFRQLYSEKPFNEYYDFLFELKGKVFQKDEFIVFATPHGLRKFNFSKLTKRESGNLIDSVYDALNYMSSSLYHLKTEIHAYYSDELKNYKGDDYLRFYKIINGTSSPDERRFDQEVLARLLNGKFDEKLKKEHAKHIAKNEKWNQMIDRFKNAPQIFI